LHNPIPDRRQENTTCVNLLLLQQELAIVERRAAERTAPIGAAASEDFISFMQVAAP
jgi:hypothetical protein